MTRSPSTMTARKGSALRAAADGLIGVGGVFTAAKSFEANPVIASRWLNNIGLHTARVTMAHRVATARRRRLEHLVSPADRADFARDGFVLKRDFVPPETFARLLEQVKSYRTAVREMIQGDTLTRKITLDEGTLRALPALLETIDSPAWRNLLAYIGGMTSRPHLFVQSILTHVAAAPPDPQTYFHADTFHPAMKAWLFLTDIEGAVPPFAYVPGSHRLTPARLDWERRQSLIAAQSPEEHTRQGSFRVEAEELAALGLGQPVQFHVPANTLIVADTFGFHARGPSPAPALRVEIWAYGRRAPFLPPPPRLPWPRRANAYSDRAGVTAFDPA